MKIPETGRSGDELLAEMESYRQRDMPWRDGRAWGYVYHVGPELEAFAKKAFTMFMSENALDPTVYPSLLRFEKEIVAMAAAHLGGGEGAVGNFTSGGTESIILAVKAARDHARATRPGVTRPRIVLPVTAHAAFHKAAHYLGLEVTSTPVDDTTFRADVAALRAAITDDTILAVGSAPGYAHGVVDPIREMAAVAAERGVLFHVDACIGGFLLPYFRRLGAEVPDFDLAVPGVTSISMDLHKYAYAPKGASVILYRDKELRAHQIFTCASWAGYTVCNPTVQSSKSGGPLAAAWAVLNHVGDDGYLEIARGLLQAKRRIEGRVAEIPGLRVLGQPQLCLIAIASERVDVFAVADAMRERGWYVQPQLSFCGSPANVHLSVGPSNVALVDALLDDLAACVAAAPAREADSPLAAVAQSLGTGALGSAEYGELLAAAGIADGELPERMADINALLDALPARAREALIGQFVNKLFS